jgi:arsenical-resistance protein 2
MSDQKFTEPRSVAAVLSRDQVWRQFSVLGDLLNAGTLLVDVRRTDYEGGTIRGSLNLPAQSFPYNMATLFRLCAGDGLAVISRVVFYCGEFSLIFFGPFVLCVWLLFVRGRNLTYTPRVGWECMNGLITDWTVAGSSSGRGPRCAGWFQDYIIERCAQLRIPATPQVYVLEGGIKGWVAAGAQFTAFVDAYVPSYWLQFSEQKQGLKRSNTENEQEEGMISPPKRYREDGNIAAEQQGTQDVAMMWDMMSNMTPQLNH